MVLWDHPVDLGLLKHDFGDENLIRIFCPAPGERTLMAPIPPKERPLERGNRLLRKTLTIRRAATHCNEVYPHHTRQVQARQPRTTSRCIYNV